jgi:hypothetical protein
VTSIEQVNFMNADRYRMRLRVRVAKSLNCEDAWIDLTILGRKVRVKSERKKPGLDPPLKEAEWVVFTSWEFETETAAREFGEQLRLVLEVVGVATRQGIATGDDKSGMHMQEEFARSMGLLTADERIAPNIHGLSVHADDDKTRFPVADIRGSVLSSTEQFIETMNEFVPGTTLISDELVGGIRVLNAALASSEPLAQMMMAFSVVEELSQDLKWSDLQRKLLDELADLAASSDVCSEEEGQEVAEAIQRGARRVGVRQGVKRFLKKIGLAYASREWDRLYSIRSELLHGTSKLTTPERSSAAFEALTLCGNILFTFAKSQGAFVPSVADKHYAMGAEFKLVSGTSLVKA